MNTISVPFAPSNHPVHLEWESFHDLLVLFVPQGMFKPNARTFGDMKEIKAVSQVAKALQLFAHLVYHPDMGQEATIELLKDPKAMLPAFPPEWYFTDEAGVRRQRTRQFIEVVRAPDGKKIVGWRFFVCALDPSTNLATGVRNQIVANAKAFNKQRARFRPAPTQPKRHEAFRKIISLSDWAYGICDTYTHTDTLSTDRTRVHDPAHGLADPLNPANPFSIFSLKRAIMIPTASAMQRNLCEYVRENADSTPAYRFPLPDQVWEIDTEAFNPGVLDQMEFPTEATQRYASPLAELSLINPEGNYKDQILDIMEATHGFVRSDFKFNQPSDLSILSQVATKLQARRTSKETVAEELASVYTFKRGFMEDFRKFWCPESHVSAVIRKMMVWETTQRTDAEELGRSGFTMTSSHTPVDTAISGFGNLMIRRMVQYEQLLQTSTVHRELLICMVARLDAYRRSFDLHTNPLLAGSGSSSKSYILNMVDKLSIPGTVQTVTHITAKADAVDENQNDVITFFHEMPKSLIGVEEKGETGDPMFKERLTSCRFKTKLFHVDEDTGKRSNRIADSECIGIIGGCTNDPPAKIPEALRSRFMVIMCPQIVRKGREVIDQFGCAQSEDVQAKKREMIFEHQAEQYLVCLIEKLIWCQILADVDMHVAHIVFRAVLGNLEAEGIHTKDPRKYTRVFNTARTLTIMNAINTVYNTPNGALYNRAFEVRDVLAVEPYLFCTEEIAFFAISLLQAEYINPVERDVGEILAKICHYPPPDPTVLSSNFREDPETGDPDYNYVKVTQCPGCYQLAGTIVKLMRGKKSSHLNVDAVLRDMLKRTISAPKRTSMLHASGAPEQMAVLMQDRNQNQFFVATAWLDRVLGSDYQNLMRTAMKGTFHKHSRARTILTGETYIARDLPHIWKTLDVEPNDAHTLIVENPAYKSSFEQAVIFGPQAPSALQTAQNQRCFAVDDDVEELHWVEHMDAIGYPDADAQDTLPANHEFLLAEAFPHVPQGRYPGAWIASHQVDQESVVPASLSHTKRRRDGSQRAVVRRVKRRSHAPPSASTLLSDATLSSMLA